MQRIRKQSVAYRRKESILKTLFRDTYHIYVYYPFKCQPHKMVKHTQTIRCLLPANCLSVFDHFVGLALKVLKVTRLKLKG